MKKIFLYASVALLGLSCNKVLTESKKLTSVDEMGIRYSKLLSSGGELPNLGDTLEVEYSGYYISGKPFFEGVKRDTVVKGSKKNTPALNSALKNMKPGESATFLFPNKLVLEGENFQQYYSDSAYLYKIKVVSVKPSNMMASFGDKPVGDTIQLNSYTKMVFLKKGRGELLKVGDNIKFSNVTVLNDMVLLNESGFGTRLRQHEIGRAPFPFTPHNLVFDKLRDGDAVKVTIDSSKVYGNSFKGGIYGDYKVDSYIEVRFVKRKPEVKAFDISGKDTLITSTGLKYIVVQKGEGKKPIEGNTVKMHYTGYHTNGDYFDSSILRGKPYKFEVGTEYIIQGWNEVAKLMPLGSKFRVIIPPSLGYGAKGRPPVIQGNETLVFDMELLQID